MTKAPNVMIAEWLDIASIPDGWEILPLRRIIRLNTGATPSRNEQDFWAGSVPWLSSKDLKSIILVDSQEKISKRALAEAGLQLHPAGQLVCCFRSGILRHTFPVCMPTFEHAINQDLRALVQIFQCMPKYLQYYLIGMNNAILATCTKVGATVESIEAKWFLDFPFVLPPKPTQQAIVEFLDAKTAEIDGLVRKLERERELLAQYRRELIARTVTRGLDPDVPMRDSGISIIGSIPEHWQTVRTRYLFRFSRGYGISRTDMQEEIGTPCVHYGDIHGKYQFLLDLDTARIGRVKDPGRFRVKDYIRANDFLFAGSSEDLEGSGNFTRITGSRYGIAGSDTIVLRPTKKFNRRFMAYFFDSPHFREQIRPNMMGTKVFHPSQRVIKSCMCVIPPLDEQKAIANFLDSKVTELDSTIAGIDRQIELLGRYRKQVINDAVTGKVRVGEVA